MEFRPNKTSGRYDGIPSVPRALVFAAVSTGTNGNGPKQLRSKAKVKVSRTVELLFDSGQLQSSRDLPIPITKSTTHFSAHAARDQISDRSPTTGTTLYALNSGGMSNSQWSERTGSGQWEDDGTNERVADFLGWGCVTTRTNTRRKLARCDSATTGSGGRRGFCGLVPDDVG